MESLYEGIEQHYCDGCQTVIISKLEVVCTVNDKAEFCSEQCEEEYEIKTRDLWLQGETNESAIFSSSSN